MRENFKYYTPVVLVNNCCNNTAYNEISKSQWFIITNIANTHKYFLTREYVNQFFAYRTAGPLSPTPLQVKGQIHVSSLHLSFQDPGSWGSSYLGMLFPWQNAATHQGCKKLAMFFKASAWNKYIVTFAYIPLDKAHSMALYQWTRKIYSTPKERESEYLLKNNSIICTFIHFYRL